ncbi:MAG: hypothetical protein ABSG98_09570 [Anaerolineales bacterium]
MTTRRLVIVLTFVAIFAMASRVSIDPDTWWHLRAGQWIVQHGAILREDVFSYTRAGAAWHYPGWLAEVLLFGLFELGSFGALNLYTAALVTLAFFFVFLSLRGDHFLVAFVLILAAVASGVYWSARPQLLSFALTGAFLWILLEYHDNSLNRLWILPPLTALWVNLHGGFAVGFILLGLFFLAEAWEVITTPRERRAVRSRKLAWLAGITVACVIAVGLNPFGYEMLFYPFKTVSMKVLQDFIQEWQSPNFHLKEAQPFLWLIFLTLAALGFSGIQMRADEFLLVVTFGYMGFLAGRNVALFSLVAPAVIVRHGQALLEKRFPQWGKRGPLQWSPGLVNWALLVLALTAAAAKFYYSAQPAVNQSEVAVQAPVGAVRYLSTRPGLGRVFNSYNWGGYLIWALPSYPVFVDGRTDLYGDSFLTDYLSVTDAAPGWQKILDRWGVTMMLVEPNQPIVPVAEGMGWTTLYQDSTSILLRRPS